MRFVARMFVPFYCVTWVGKQHTLWRKSFSAATSLEAMIARCYRSKAFRSLVNKLSVLMRCDRLAVIMIKRGKNQTWNIFTLLALFPRFKWPYSGHVKLIRLNSEWIFNLLKDFLVLINLSRLTHQSCLFTS